METRRVSCPGCYEREEVHRSHLKFWDVPFLLIGMRPYRCLLCYRRFYTWKRGPARVRKAAAKGV
jgi:hypothetical protein